MDNVRNDLDSKEELLRRLPELDAIYVDELRDDAIQTFMSACPDTFGSVRLRALASITLSTSGVSTATGFTRSVCLPSTVTSLSRGSNLVR